MRNNCDERSQAMADQSAGGVQAPVADQAFEFAGGFGDGGKIAGLHGGGGDQFAADANRRGSGREKLRGGGEIDSAGRDQRDLGKGGFQRSDVGGSADVPA